MTQNPESGQKIEELRVLEANLQGIMTQRQSVQMEVNEIENALSELKDYDDDAFKVVSGIMIKVEKEKIVEELNEKKKIVEMKKDAIEKQEKLIEKKISDVRVELDGLVGKK